jgi:hypothetical protein
MADAIIPAPVVTTQNKYVMDYSTAARTNPVLTAAVNTVTLTATASLAGYAWSEVAANQLTVVVNQLRGSVNALISDVTASKATLAAIVADMQANNLAK